MATGRVQVTLLHVVKDAAHETDMAQVGSESGYYYLPGADYQETLAALREAGFHFGSSFADAIEARVASESDEGG